jgi:excisionase family DNA binding protein
MLKEYEQEKLWDTMSFLCENNKIQQAETVLKMIVKETLEELKHSTDVLNDLTFHVSPPAHKAISELRKLDKTIREHINQHDLELANEAFLKYLAQISEDQNHIIGTLLSKKYNLPETSYSKEYYRVGEVAKKLGLSEQTIRRHCEENKYPGAFKTKGGHWRIPTSLFRTSNRQDRVAEQFFKRLDEKNKMGGDDVDEFNLHWMMQTRL